jgi:hypothetical protein
MDEVNRHLRGEVWPSRMYVSKTEGFTPVCFFGDRVAQKNTVARRARGFHWHNKLFRLRRRKLFIFMHLTRGDAGAGFGSRRSFAVSNSGTGTVLA